MKTEAALKALEALEKQLHAYRHALGVMNLDSQTCAPAASAPARSETLEVLSQAVHQLLTGEGLGEILAELTAAGEGLPPKTRRQLEELRERREELTRIPLGEYVEYARLCNEADAVWHAAKANSDFPAFAPYLEKLVDYNRRFAGYKDASKAPYDVLLDDFEKGASMAMLDPFFARLQAQLTPLILALKDRPQPEDGFLHQFFPIEAQRRFSQKLMALEGIDPARCVIGETEHPFTDGFNRWDVRITTRYDEHDVAASLYSVLHEGGHALYELGVAEELQFTSLGGGSSMGIHESQSRFYENLIGRSRPFCHALLPLLKACFPQQFAGVDEEALYRAVNVAKPSLIRTEADELTYALHIIVRYELEKRLIGAELAVRDLPGAWNELYKAYLGLDVPDDRRGVLQDSHWSGGSFGYFPSYALGSAYGAQMLRRMEGEADIWPAVARGDLSPVTAWLGEKIHRYGMLLTPAQLLENACGAPFDPQYYIDYLTKKYSELYRL